MFDFVSFQQRAEQILQHIQQDISSLRTGRANASILDSVLVEAYGSRMKINELAQISTPDPTMLVVSPWDKSVLEAIAKGITISGLSLNPVVDGEIIRISIPALTEERRQEMVKLLKQKIESGRVMLRNLRSDVRKEIDHAKAEDGVSEDDVKRWQADLDKKVKDIEVKIADMEKRKEDELMKI